MQIKGWEYYNHAALPTYSPHEQVDLAPIENGQIWKLDGSPLLARWTTNFDCEEETNWWYVIKDEPFDISLLKSKRRYEINKGVKNFDVYRINPLDYKEEIYKVQVAAFSAYPEKYRPTVNHDEFIKGIAEWDKFIVYGAFFKENKELCGYSLIRKTDKCIHFNVQKTIPEYEGKGVNAVLVVKILNDQKDFLENDGYICDGARSISHETNFQDYLEKYFMFRKAYCNLHIKYKPKILFIVRTLYPFRKILKNLDNIRMIHKINGILKMEEIVKNGK